MESLLHQFHQYLILTQKGVGKESELFYNLCDLIIADCCNIRVIETKFGAPGNRTPLFLYGSN